MEIKTYTVTPIETNCILLKDKATNKMAVVDPGDKSDKLIDEIIKIGKNNLEYILLTHGHYDHIGYAKQLAEMFNCKIVIGEKEKEFLFNGDLNLSSKAFRAEIEPFKADILLKDNETINLGETEIQFIHTPGHTIGGGCYIFNNIIIAGDTLFYESIGRIDLPTGSGDMMLNSLERLYNLKGNYKVYPGHGPSTTLDHERQFNSYMKNMSVY